MRNELLGIIFSIPAIIIAFTVQGYAKAWMADRLGDRTPRFQGRLTLNPVAHIDPIGFLMILLVKFGWTKPVETNPSAYKRGYKDVIKVSLAGPIGNLITGFIATIIYVFAFNLLHRILPDTIFIIITEVLFYIAVLNVNLFVFNLLPLPGLAGFDILRTISPKNFYKISDIIYQYYYIIMIVIVLIAGWVISIPSAIIFNAFLTVAKMLIGIFI